MTPEEKAENDRRSNQACDLANDLLALVHKAETPGVQTLALALALGAVLGGHATTAVSLNQVLDLSFQQMAEQAVAHFNRRLQTGDAFLGIPGLDAAPTDKGSIN